MDNNILFEQKRAELQVKLTILKENLMNIKSQIDQSSNNLTDISSKYISGIKIAETKSYQLSSLEIELTKEQKTFEGLKIYCKNLKREKDNNESENTFYQNKICELKAKNVELRQFKSEMSNKRHLLNMEIEQLRSDQSSYNKVKYDNEKLQNTTKGQHEYVTTSIEDNNTKIKLLQIKLDSFGQEVESLDTQLKEAIYSNEQCDAYNNDIAPKICELKETAKSFNIKLQLVQKEIDETKDYINSSKEDKVKLVQQMNILGEILDKINITNIKINASLNIMIMSLQKKAIYLQKDQEYFEESLEEKAKFLKVLKDISSYKDLI